MYCFNNHKTQKSESFKNLRSEVVTNRRIKQEIRERTRNSGHLSAGMGHCLEMGNAKNGKILNISTNKRKV